MNLTPITKFSLTPTYFARVKMIEPLLKIENRYRKKAGFPPLGMDEFIRLYYDCTPFEWLSKPLSDKDRRFLYFGF